MRLRLAATQATPKELARPAGLEPATPGLEGGKKMPKKIDA
jgi:hypothetical protein